MRICVLLVDDEAPIVSAIMRAFVSKWTVTACTSGKEALEILTTPTDFDAIVLDVFMPDMNGLELFERLEREAPARCGRVLFYTAGADHKVLRPRLRELGRPVVGKPADLRTLEIMVEEIARRPGPRGPRALPRVKHDTPHLRAIKEVVDDQIDSEIARLHMGHEDHAGLVPPPERSTLRRLPSLSDDEWFAEDQTTGGTPRITVRATEAMRSAIEDVVKREREQHELAQAAGRWASVVKWATTARDKFAIALIAAASGFLVRELGVMIVWAWKHLRH